MSHLLELDIHEDQNDTEDIYKHAQVINSKLRNILVRKAGVCLQRSMNTDQDYTLSDDVLTEVMHAAYMLGLKDGS